MRTALITGITGQDGAYLAQFLLEKKYRVMGLVRSYTESKVKNLIYLGIAQKVELESCDLSDITQIINILRKFEPEEIYNLAAQSSVSQSFSQPIGTIHFNIFSVLNLLEAVKLVGLKEHTAIYQASSSEMYGLVKDLPITERTAFHPLSPYGISKASAHWITVNYRESYGLRASCGVLFNHESYLRPEGFFVKKVIKDALLIKNGTKAMLTVGNIQIKRDFGYAKKYVEAMWLILQQQRAGDYLICSGQSISLQSIVEYVFQRVGVSWDKLSIDPTLYRPTEIPDIFGNNEKARKELGWNYDMNFYEVLDILIDEERLNLVG